MTHRIIGIGETSSFRYFGITEALETTAIDSIYEQIILPDWITYQRISCEQHLEGDGPAHTELGIDVGFALDWLGRETVDAGAVKIAEQMARILINNGDTVEVLSDIVTTDFQTPIFGRWATETRKRITERRGRII